MRWRSRGTPLAWLVAMLVAAAPLAHASAFRDALVQELRERLVSYEQGIEEQGAGIERSEAISKQAQSYLDEAEVRRNPEIARPFREAKMRAERALASHRHALAQLRLKLRHTREQLRRLPEDGLSSDQAFALSAQGAISVRRAGENALSTVEATEPLILSPGDLIEVGAEGEISFLTPSLGAELSIGRDTRVLLEKIEASAEDATPALKLYQGEVRFGLSKLSNALARFVPKLPPARKRFEVKTPTATTAVRGTHFAVTYLGGATRIAVLEGIVEVTAGGHQETIEVEGGSLLLIEPDGAIRGPAAMNEEQWESFWIGDDDRS